VAPAGSTPIILVVDDEPALLTVMARTLSHSGCRIMTASDGADALAMLESLAAPVQLLVSDIRMPRLTGDALGTLALERGLARRVLFITGFGPAPEEVARLGPVLKKPFNLGVFRDRVESMLAL